MSKITFRAADDLVRRLEALDASKSEVMREALRAYLDGDDSSAGTDPASVNAGDEESADGDSLEGSVAERVDAVLADRLASSSAPEPRDVNVTVTLEGLEAALSSETESNRKTTEGSSAADDGERVCKQCGEELPHSAVYCANCGEKAAQRAFCECGDELRSDWAFCPSCGRRTPAADVLGDS